MFEIGAKVRVKDTGPSYRGQVGIVEPSLGQSACIVKFSDGFRDAYFFVDLELVEEPRRLYRKGDKITVTYTVTTDEADSMNAARNNQLPVTAPGLSEKSGSHYVSLAMLREGVLEPAPEPPYVPKPGDEFFLYPSHRMSPYTCLYIDDRVILTRRNGAENLIVRRVTHHEYRKA